VVDFLYFTSGVTYRVPKNDDGTLGAPQILKKWTSETYAPKKKAVKKAVKKASKPMASEEEGTIFFQ